MQSYSITSLPKQEAEVKEIKEFKINVLSETNYPLSMVTAKLLDSIYSRLKEEFTSERTIPPFFKETSRIMARNHVNRWCRRSW